MISWLERAIAPRGLDDGDLQRRAVLITIAMGATAAYLIGAAVMSVVDGRLAPAACAATAGLLAGAACGLARAGKLAAAEYASIVMVVTGSCAVVILHGPESNRLGAVYSGVVFLGLTTRPRFMILQVVVAIAALCAAIGLELAIPASPATTPPWLDVAQHVLITTMLMLVFVTGYHRVHDRLVQRTISLDVAHAELMTARGRLERMVETRTAELERASVDLEAFASTVAHDLRAPLRRIRQFLQLAAEDAVELPEATLDAIHAVQAAASELSGSVDGILAEHRQAIARRERGAS
ncbi:MAG TPA: histidine kinase dimerization/phospho-acceptor domain-containing protein [Kofleriaceae bacterium]|nr:histidine kinase dimerization/phospho-acceptor domain-containing protein [Kofleriaceae bacterium]